MNHQEFPQLPDLSGSYEVPLTQTILKDMLSKTAFSASKEDSRYALNGLQLQVGDQKVIFIGTDGKRLAKVITPVAIDPGIVGSYLFPLKAIEEMTKMLEDTEAPAILSLSHDKIALQAGHFSLTTKLLTGQYPDVERVIPSKVIHDFSIHREELMSLLRQVSLFTSDQSSSVRFSFETGQLHLSATSNEIGEGRVSMPVDYVGSKLDIAFNPFYFLDILRHSKDETVRFGLNDSHNPGMITDTTNALFVIMPMRLSEAPAAAVHVS
jgi:DNA polymerase-3 subunit beta